MQKLTVEITTSSSYPLLASDILMALKDMYNPMGLGDNKIEVTVRKVDINAK